MTAGREPEQSTTTGWPWRPGNRFRLLADGGEFFACMHEAIDAARALVLLEMYLVNSGAAADALHRCAGRGGRRGARVCVIFDGFGSLGMSRHDRRRLLEAGVELRFFNPLSLTKRMDNLLRDHRKLLVTDGHTAFVGGAGLTDEFAPGARGGAWRDQMLRIEGPVVADWQRAFARTWRRCGGELAPAPVCPPYAAGATGRLALSEAAPALGARQRRHPPHRRRRRARVDHERLLRAVAALPQGAAARGTARRRRAAAGAGGAHRPPVGAAGGAALLRQAAAQRSQDLRVPAARPARQDDPVRRVGIGRLEQPRPLELPLEPGSEPGGRRRRFRRIPRRRCSPPTSPSRARSAAAPGGSAPGSIACASASPARSTATSTAGGVCGGGRIRAARRS